MGYEGICKQEYDTLGLSKHKDNMMTYGMSGYPKLAL
jgi:hypothetical protein